MIREVEMPAGTAIYAFVHVCVCEDIQLAGLARADAVHTRTCVTHTACCHLVQAAIQLGTAAVKQLSTTGEDCSADLKGPNSPHQLTFPNLLPVLA